MLRLILVIAALALGSGHILNARGELELLSAITAKNAEQAAGELAKRQAEGLRMDWEDPHERNLVHLAVLNDQNPEVVRLVLEKGANALHQDEQGRSPLHYAIDANNLAAAKVLIEHIGMLKKQRSPTVLSALNYCQQGLRQQPKHETCLFILAALK